MNSQNGYGPGEQQQARCLMVGIRGPQEAAPATLVIAVMMYRETASLT